MNYELAKKLKDAGFPQTYKKSSPWADFAYKTNDDELHLLHEDNDTQWWIGNDYSSQVDEEKMNEEWVKVPTLEELIEACGERLWGLTRHGNFWQTNWVDGFAGDSGGYTPSEAVANLWLALNKK